MNPENCQSIDVMTPLNDLLLGQTFIIETNEQPLFINDTQVNIKQLFNLIFFFNIANIILL